MDLQGSHRADADDLPEVRDRAARERGPDLLESLHGAWPHRVAVDVHAHAHRGVTGRTGGSGPPAVGFWGGPGGAPPFFFLRGGWGGSSRDDYAQTPGLATPLYHPPVI